MDDEKKSESPSYSAEHWRTIRRGLRLWARIAIRAQLQRLKRRSEAAQAPRPKEEDSAADARDTSAC